MPLNSESWPPLGSILFPCMVSAHSGRTGVHYIWKSWRRLWVVSFFRHCESVKALWWRGIWRMGRVWGKSFLTKRKHIVSFWILINLENSCSAWVRSFLSCFRVWLTQNFWHIWQIWQPDRRDSCRWELFFFFYQRTALVWKHFCERASCQTTYLVDLGQTVCSSFPAWGRLLCGHLRLWHVRASCFRHSSAFREDSWKKWKHSMTKNWFATKKKNRRWKNIITGQKHLSCRRISTDGYQNKGAGTSSATWLQEETCECNLVSLSKASLWTDLLFKQKLVCLKMCLSLFGNETGMTVKNALLSCVLLQSVVHFARKSRGRSYPRKNGAGAGAKCSHNFLSPHSEQCLFAFVTTTPGQMILCSVSDQPRKKFGSLCWHLVWLVGSVRCRPIGLLHGKPWKVHSCACRLQSSVICKVTTRLPVPNLFVLSERTRSQRRDLWNILNPHLFDVGIAGQS